MAEVGVLVLVVWSLLGWVIYNVTPTPKKDALALAKALACGPAIWCQMRFAIRRR